MGFRGQCPGQQFCVARSVLVQKPKLPKLLRKLSFGATAALSTKATFALSSTDAVRAVADTDYCGRRNRQFR